MTEGRVGLIVEVFTLIKDDMCGELWIRQGEGLVREDDVASFGFEASDLRRAGPTIIA
jgi:hypothetical protein